MRYLDEDEAKLINAEPWHTDLLKANPSYTSWGPHEDYMIRDGNGWDSRIILANWEDFACWELNDLNECVNFYFEVNRAQEQCKTCGGNGYHPDAHCVSETFYPHMCLEQGLPRSAAWKDKITQDECDALIKNGRIPADSTAEKINAQNSPSARGFGHDAINKWILIETRLKRLGLPKDCPSCDGRGYTFTEPCAHVSLILWWLHPRKGCSRGIEVTRIQREDLPSIQMFLKNAANRNAERFSKIGMIWSES